MATEYENLREWTRPQYYMGAEWHGFYSAGVGQSRDSDPLERANFRAMVDILTAAGKGWQAGDDPQWEEAGAFVVVRESHWAVGWVEWIAIRGDCQPCLAAANEACARLEDYPVLDDDIYSEEEGIDCQATWDAMDWRERAKWMVGNYWKGDGLTLLKVIRDPSGWSHHNCSNDLAHR